MKWLDDMGYLPLVLIAVFLGMAPWPGGPMPHLLEKLNMLFSGTLTRPIDIFDLFLHASPIILISIKIVRQLQSARKNSKSG